jgi:hypothetical protein
VSRWIEHPRRKFYLLGYGLCLLGVAVSAALALLVADGCVFIGLPWVLWASSRLRDIRCPACRERVADVSMFRWRWWRDKPRDQCPHCKAYW